MYVAATFEHSTFLELAISELEQKGITRENIYAFPLKLRVKERKLFDTMSRADGISLFDGMAAWGTVFTVLGTIFGYMWAWGPVIWGLIGMAFGAAFGFFLDLFLVRSLRRENDQKHLKNLKGRISEVVLIIECDQDQVKMVEHVLWDNLAIGVS
ncbi:MAG: hypothetical protein HPY50_02530 [Firmicutes bacterium]|nr:hypothetical protein [Bacillota bacterium]